MDKEKQIQEYESKQLIDELSKMPPKVIAAAYLHAINYTLYGIDVTEKLKTATQITSTIAKAYNKGYNKGYHDGLLEWIENGKEFWEQMMKEQDAAEQQECGTIEDRITTMVESRGGIRMKDVSDILIVSFGNKILDKPTMRVFRKNREQYTIVLKIESGEQADILYHLLTEQMTKAEIKVEEIGRELQEQMMKEQDTIENQECETMKVVFDELIVSFDNGLKDESVLYVARKYGDKSIMLKMEVGEQADILYHLLTEQMTKAEIKIEGEEN